MNREQSFTLVLRKTARSPFRKLLLCCTFPAVIKTKLPADPFLGLMNAFEYTFGSSGAEFEELLSLRDSF